MDLGLRGKRALVLGASRGLGKAIAQSLAAEGATVFAAARSLELIDSWSKDLANVRPVKLDLADLISVDAVVNDLLASGGIDIIVNNSGGPPPGTAQEADRVAWITHFEAMAANIFHLTTHLLPSMKARGWGRVISITSSGVEQPIPNLACQTASAQRSWGGQRRWPLRWLLTGSR